MSPPITDWLKRESFPEDIYQMLGHPRLDPDVAAMRQSLNEASRELLPYQGHNDPDMAKRAMRLLTDLGAADMVLSTPDKLDQHREQILDLLATDYSVEHGDDPANWKRGHLKKWLIESQNVHPEAAGEAVNSLCPPPEPKPTRARSGTGGRSQARKNAQNRRGGQRSAPARRRKRQHASLESLFDDLGVERKQPPRRKSDRGGGGRRRKRRGKPPWVMPVSIAGGVLLVLILAVALWPAKDRSSTLVLTVDPADAQVNVEHEGVTAAQDGATWTVTIDNAEDLEERVVVRVSREGYHSQPMEWSPQPRTTLEQNIKLKQEIPSD